jgi:DNA invertase Pin-like site-specific DNA recombinase
MKLHIGYFRVSTLQQGVAGLGMEAQREAVARYVRSHGTLLAEYTEVESGRRHKNRPQLLAALAHCKKDRATLVIAKLDRLGRNVAFISALLESNVQFVCCDNPHATKTMLQMLAVFAEHEREQISERTKAALAAAKARGIRLGNPRYAESLARARAARGYKDAPPEVHSLISAWRNSDETLQAIADRLNGLNIRTPQDYRWYPSSVRSALLKIEKAHNSTMGEKNEIAPSSISRLPDLLLPANSSVVSSSAGREATTEGDVSMSEISEAERMIDIFTSVGARSFVVTKLDINQTLIWGKAYSASELRDKLPAMVRTAAIRKPFAISETEIVMAGENLIVRPTGSVHFVQLDDLSAEQIERVRPAAFLIHSTSPGNHQAWIAASGLPADKEVFKDFMRRVRKAVGGNDKSASHATRLGGTENFKLKYHPDFPVVAITHAVPGRVLTSDQLSQLGLLAEAERIKPPAFVPRSSSERPWPSYEIAIMRAPRKADGTPDRSKADYSWALIALTGGKNVEETIAKLAEVSPRAMERTQRGDRGYARITVENAAAAVARNFSKGRSRA